MLHKYLPWISACICLVGAIVCFTTGAYWLAALDFALFVSMVGLGYLYISEEE